MGTLLGLSERIIGLTIISAGTGLPELATSAVAAYKGRSDIAVANVVGSNLMNTMGVAGAASVIRDIPIEPTIAHHDTIVLFVTTLLLIPIIWLGKFKINRAMGLVLSLSYCAYIATLLYR